MQEDKQMKITDLVVRMVVAGAKTQGLTLKHRKEEDAFEFQREDGEEDEDLVCRSGNALIGLLAVALSNAGEEAFNVGEAALKELADKDPPSAEE